MADVSENLGFTLVNPQEDGDEALNLFSFLNYNLILADAAIGNLTPAALKLGLHSTNIAGILEELADRIIEMEGGGSLNG